ncbi:Hypothetical protein CAP_6478 [Chondromyces apiculatus DSM 436]|uniref:Uncharacterized protein n=1 Tax=Chondromyces apiculatus DSM 436 TaxID=1192034 RepID=A0A017T0I8_9BACT|nr:Hypothetical protein CAP_6478 [Chondromyces apiculatus DSM 436]
MRRFMRRPQGGGLERVSGGWREYLEKEKSYRSRALRGTWSQ